MSYDNDDPLGYWHCIPLFIFPGVEIGVLALSNKLYFEGRYVLIGNDIYVIAMATTLMIIIGIFNIAPFWQASNQITL